MKKLLLIFAIFTLVGCQAAPSDQEPQAQEETDQSTLDENRAYLEEQEKIINTYLGELDNLDQIVAAGDITKCETLKSDSNKATCEIDILISKASSEGDEKYCKDFEGSLKESCIEAAQSSQL